MVSLPVPLRDFTFRALLFDAECEEFRKSGLNIGIPHDEAEPELLHEALSPFSLAIRSSGLRMIRLYALFYCFENSVRELISAKMIENKGPNWWDGVGEKIRKFAESRKTASEQNTWIEGEPATLLSYIEFGHLSDIIFQNWEVFEDLIPSQQWMKQRFDELEKLRNFVAHNRSLKDNEFDRVEMYVSDWGKQVGF